MSSKRSVQGIQSGSNHQGRCHADLPDDVPAHFDDTQHGADLFDPEGCGQHLHPHHEPPQAVLSGASRRNGRQRGRASAIASGMSAITYAIQTIAETGDNIVSPSRSTAPATSSPYASAGGIGVLRRPATRQASHRSSTRAPGPCSADRGQSRWAASPTSPRWRPSRTDHGVPLIVITGFHAYLCRPAPSNTAPTSWCIPSIKYMNGHGNLASDGAIVDSGEVPGPTTGPFRRLNDRLMAYHGVVYTEALGPGGLRRPRARRCRCATWARRSAVTCSNPLDGNRDRRAAHGPDLRGNATLPGLQDRLVHTLPPFPLVQATWSCLHSSLPLSTKYGVHLVNIIDKSFIHPFHHLFHP